MRTIARFRRTGLKCHVAMNRDWRPIMRRISIAGLAAILLLPVLLANGSRRQAVDPEKALSDINAWYREQIQTAQKEKKTPDYRKLMTERTEKAKTAVEGTAAESVAPEKG